MHARYFTLHSGIPPSQRRAPGRASGTMNMLYNCCHGRRERGHKVIRENIWLYDTIVARCEVYSVLLLVAGSWTVKDDAEQEVM